MLAIAYAVMPGKLIKDKNILSKFLQVVLPGKHLKSLINMYTCSYEIPSHGYARPNIKAHTIAIDECK